MTHIKCRICKIEMRYSLTYRGFSRTLTCQKCNWLHEWRGKTVSEIEKNIAGLTDTEWVALGRKEI